MPTRVTGICIYCGETKPLSAEHYLSRGLGIFKNNEMLKDRVCRDCNGSFKLLEEQFLRGSDIAFFRVHLGIEGRSAYSQKVNPFVRGSAGAPPIKMQGKFPGKDFPVLFEPNPGLNSADMLTQVVYKKGDQFINVIIPEDMEDPEAFKALLLHRGVDLNENAFVSIKTSEMDRVSKLFSFLGKEFSAEWEDSPTEGKLFATIHFEVTDRYFRAIAKIGFHYFLKYFPVFRGTEDAFADIRNFIMNGGPISEVEKFVTYDNKQLIQHVEQGYLPKTYLHALSARAHAKRMFVKLQFFLGPEHVAPVYTVNLGKNPLRIVADQVIGHIFQYHETIPTDGFDGVMTEVPLLTTKLII